MSDDPNFSIFSLQTVDVLAQFKKLRDCRLNMVGNESQYLFAHLVLAELLVSLPTALPLDQSFHLLVKEQKQNLPHLMERLVHLYLNVIVTR